MEGLRVLTVVNHGETESENERTTLNPMEIDLTSARDDVRQSRPMFKVNVQFKSGNFVELYLVEYDLLQVEKAVGSWGLLED